MKKEKLLLCSTIIAIFLVAGCVNSPSETHSTETTSHAVSTIDFAKCLTEKGVTVYGFGTDWCTFCMEQKELFGTAWNDLNYVECSISEDYREQSESCTKAGIQGYPTWVLKSGEKIDEKFSFESLSQRTDCPIPTSQGLSSETDGNTEVPIVNDQAIQFEVVQPFPSGNVGAQYQYSFCKPDLTLTSELCEGNEITNPRRGNPPYHFSLDSGAFAPKGISLNLNGILSGIPTTEGENTFRVCAIDLSGNQSCKQVTLVIGPAITTPETWTGTMTGTYANDAFLGGGTYGYDFRINFTVPKSIIATYKDPENNDLRFGMDETSGTISETTTIIQQINHSNDLMIGGSLNETIQVINGSHIDSPHTIQFHSPTNKELIAGYLQRTDLPALNDSWGDLVLTVTNYTETTITGTWGTVDYGELKARGTFTFNKQ